MLLTCNQIHVDEYKLRLYKAAAEASEYGIACLEALPLVGFKSGNHTQLGCLTDDESVRIHSCDKGERCSALQQTNVVWIIPVLSYIEGSLVREKGDGGGGGDLAPKHEVQMDLGDAKVASEWIRLCAERIADNGTRSKIVDLIESASKSKSKALPLSEGHFPANQSPGDGFTAILNEITNCALDFPMTHSLDFAWTKLRRQADAKHLMELASREIVRKSLFR